MKIVVISASPRKTANTQIMMQDMYDYTKTKNADTKFINLSKDKIDCYEGPDGNYSEVTKQATKDIMEADVWLIGTPIYNSFFSSALKNLFEYVNYKKTAGKISVFLFWQTRVSFFVFNSSLLRQGVSYGWCGGGLKFLRKHLSHLLHCVNSLLLSMWKETKKRKTLRTP